MAGCCWSAGRKAAAGPACGIFRDSPSAPRSPPLLRRELVENVRTLAGVVVVPGEPLKTLTHGVTRFRITLTCYEAAFLSDDETVAGRLETRWLRPAELDGYPLNSTGRKLAKWIGRKEDRV